jgi:hypothetical protein
MMSRDNSEKTLMIWLEECLVVTNSSLEEILSVMLAQLERGFKGFIGVLNMTNRTKRKKKS